jgi:hypothetical protein
VLASTDRDIDYRSHHIFATDVCYWYVFSPEYCICLVNTASHALLGYNRLILCRKDPNTSILHDCLLQTRSLGHALFVVGENT